MVTPFVSKSSVENVLDSRPEPQGKMPSRSEMIQKMEHRLLQEGVKQLDVTLFVGCARDLTDHRLFKAYTMFWETRNV